MSADSISIQVASPAPPTGFRELWRQLPDRGVLLCLLGAWTVLFHFLGTSTFGYVKTHSMFGWWYWVYTRGAVDESGNLQLSKLLNGEEWHGAIIPLVVLALLWRRRDEWRTLPKRVWWPALGLFLAAVLMHVVGYLVQQERVAVAAYFVGIYGLTCLVWGPGWARLALFPFILFVFCVPLGQAGSEIVTFPLRLLATQLTAVFSHTILGINVVRTGTQLFNPTGAYNYEVAAACGGLRSLTVVVAFSVIMGYVTFQSMWRRLGLVAAAAPLAVAANVVRLTMIILAAEVFGQDWGNFVHENWFFSLVPYVVAFGGLFLLTHWMRENRPPKAPREALVLGGAKQGL